ncbi:hypothetical protein [Shewanella sp. UCD-KL21]|uniref:hypothetical protein n=1 Tax=Shewanella sp. UCD-KL21 TaxID=1917164 RepID=UPI000970F5FF|nr:hypothetical protein [Shewanella sp. UCD-KL21]
MITVKNKSYKCYLIDSNFIIQMFKERESFGSNVINRVFSDGLFVFSPVSLWEISQDECFDEFISVFSTLPSLLALSDDDIVNKELENYEGVEPTSIKDITFLLSGNSPHELNLIIKNYINKALGEDYKATEKQYFKEMKGRNSFGYLDGQSLSNKKAIKSSVDLVAFEFISNLVPSFCKTLQANSSALNVTRFPSQVSKSYIYHYKFAHPSRKGEPSDLSDILISSILPYIDVYLTEKSVANSIREIRDVHGFYKGLETITMKQMRPIKEA